MRVELKSLQPNPMRDFTIDPIDDDRVKELAASIKEDGFWGGVVCRRTENNGIQIAAGHHRINAAIKAGIREADVFTGDMDDASMIRIYARENALQRGNTGTALAGSVAAAIRFLSKAVMTGSIATPDFRRRFDIEEMRRHLEIREGLGWPVITWFLDGVPDINKNTVSQQLANFKASGDYARIIREVQQQIEKENQEALKELERAEREKVWAEEEQRRAEAAQKEAEDRRREAARAAKAAKDEADRKRAAADAQRAELARQKADAEAKLAAKRKAESDEQMKQFEALKKTRDTAEAAANKAEKREQTFDFEGVAKHFKNSNHIDVFRQLATSEGVRPYLPVNKQAALAKALFNLAGDSELTGRFIRENFMSMVMDVKHTERRLNAKEKADLINKEWSAKARVYQEDASRGARTFVSAVMSLSGHDKKRPKGVTLQATSEFRNAVEGIKRAVALIEKAGLL